MDFMPLIAENGMEIGMKEIKLSQGGSVSGDDLKEIPLKDWLAQGEKVMKTPEKSMSQKYRDKEITHKQYIDYLANKPIPIPTEKSMWKKFLDGEISHNEYDNYCAKKKGFKDSAEYAIGIVHKNGLHKPMAENKDCSQYLGIVWAERILSKVFEGVKRMPNNNEGFDFVCKKGYKIDVKSSTLHKSEHRNSSWSFNIKCNRKVDYFLFIAFDNRDDKTPINEWLIKRDEIIRGKELCNYQLLVITNTPEGLSEFECFEQKDKLEKTIDCCNSMRSKHAQS